MTLPVTAASSRPASCNSHSQLGPPAGSREPLHLHAEAGGEGLGQHDEVGVAREGREQRGEMRAIGRRVLPDERLLNQRDAQNRHGSAAPQTRAQTR